MDEDTKIKVLKNGSVYDREKGQIVKGPPLSSAQASALAKKSIEARRRVVRDAANAAVTNDNYRAQFGSMAYIAEIAAAAQRKASNPADPKAIEAARWLMQYTGESEDSPVPSPPDSADDLRMLIRDLLHLAQAVEAARTAGA